MQIALVFPLDGLLFVGVITFGRLDDIAIETAAKRSYLAFRYSIARASSLLRMLLHSITQILYARLFAASTVSRTAVPFGRVVLLNFHGAAHRDIRNLSRVWAQESSLGMIDYDLAISSLKSAWSWISNLRWLSTFCHRLRRLLLHMFDRDLLRRIYEILEGILLGHLTNLREASDTHV